ncbi:MAG: hypothetical protein V1725_07075 [archaeon]
MLQEIITLVGCASLAAIPLKERYARFRKDYAAYKERATYRPRTYAHAKLTDDRSSLVGLLHETPTGYVLRQDRQDLPLLLPKLDDLIERPAPIAEVGGMWSFTQQKFVVDWICYEEKGKVYELQVKEV